MRRRTARELTALADGSLAPHRCAALLRRVARWPELAQALEEQRFAVAAIRGITTPAPAGLRAWVDFFDSNPALDIPPAGDTWGRG